MTQAPGGYTLELVDIPPQSLPVLRCNGRISAEAANRILGPWRRIHEVANREPPPLLVLDESVTSIGILTDEQLARLGLMRIQA